jgi:hypothetical protein
MDMNDGCRTGPRFAPAFFGRTRQRISNMRLVSIVAVLFVGTGACRAGDLNIQVILSGEVAPGVYGQVQLGNDRPPPLVYTQPMLIVAQPEPPPPVYLHVPPGHARNWRKYCREYNACNRPVYFIRSAEYEPGFDRSNYDREHEDRGRWRDGDHEHGDREHGDRERWQDGDHEHHHDRDDDHGHDRHDDNR